ncbi:hypothetical protein ISF_05725 [Cordyceps fumosorosea ARSEF 2679]|uniref:Uncharacterized protein n=1 Tax=Cordyceps fumosorosea (strain ARSEF 2679) TaxID=1081104 RepID=A0A167TK75_CORFA|nr:hypothetical protein ISF_05725 [Cordyceps fumosorosea ARSEF 2679]OAA60686.1 hypothetical protein ISF_05725 [Cordyceps fumosorosea ARSEF 2679]
MRRLFSPPEQLHNNIFRPPSKVLKEVLKAALMPPYRVLKTALMPPYKVLKTTLMPHLAILHRLTKRYTYPPRPECHFPLSIICSQRSPLELEAACFEFARAKMPAVLEKNDWTCAEATELNLIARALGKYQKPLPGVARLPRGVTAGKVLRAMENIRHAAVHREYLKAKDLWAMLRDGESLLILLKNEGRLASMKSLREEVTKYILKLKEDETDVKESIATAHNFAAVQIARLKQQEAEAVAQAEARRAAFRCSYGEQITALVANFHVKGATQIRQPSFEAAAAAFLLFFARFMRSAFMLVFDILCRLYAVLAGIFL